MRHVAFILVLLSFDVALAADQKGGTVVIKNFGILGPVTGSQDTAGRVDIEVTGPKIGSPVIELRSSDQGVAAVPMTVTSSQGTAIFVVKTASVTKPTEVTITAQVGTSSKSATLQILPPKLNVLGCDLPANVIPQKPLTCTAWLDGLAAEAITVNLTSSRAAAIVPPNVTIRRGEHKQTFQVNAEPIAQSASVQLSATYAGVTKSTPVTVLPVALESLTISQATALGGEQPKITVKLTAPPPQGGLVVHFSAQVTPPQTGSVNHLMSIYPGVMVMSQQQDVPVFTFPVPAPISVTITGSTNFVTAGDTKQVKLEIEPAMLKSISINPDHFSNVSLGGQQATVTLQLTGWGPDHGAVDLQYGGDTQITGPSPVIFGYKEQKKDFPVTVSPCSVQQTCKVFIKARYLGVEKQTSATVTK